MSPLQTTQVLGDLNFRQSQDFLLLWTLIKGRQTVNFWVFVPMNVQLSTAGLETISNVFGLLSPIRYYITSSSSDLRFDVVPITQAQLAASTNPAEYVPPPTEDGLGNLLTTSNDVRQHRNDGLNACPSST